MLKKYDNGKSRDVVSIVTGDETWIYFYDVLTRAQSKISVFEDEPPPTAVMRQRSVGKRMYAIFFRKTGSSKLSCFRTRRQSPPTGTHRIAYLKFWRRSELNDQSRQCVSGICTMTTHLHIGPRKQSLILRMRMAHFWTILPIVPTWHHATFGCFRALRSSL